MQGSILKKHRIEKSKGVTPTEELLTELCESTFLKLWSYPNPYKEDGHELCDLIVVFENSVFIFFDREKSFEFEEGKDPDVLWKRWKRKAVEAQLQTAYGAERYLKAGNKIYVDRKRKIPLPFQFNPETATYHKFVIAHGASEACFSHSEENITGSLAISYGEAGMPFPFFIDLARENPINVLDSHTLPLILGELDTISDFERFLLAKYDAIKKYESLSYCGEEDLLAHYYRNYDEELEQHIIGPKDGDYDFIAIGEGEWQSFSQSEPYKLTKSANKISYLWDEIIQRSSDFALQGESLGSSPLGRNSAILEMAKEPRFVRRECGKQIEKAVRDFPEEVGEMTRKLTLMPSFQKNKAYIFLQFYFPDEFKKDKEFRTKRQTVLEIACGSAKLRFPNLETIVGILIESPKHSENSSEDFILMFADSLSEEDLEYYKEMGDAFKFFKTATPEIGTTRQFINSADEL